MLVARKILVVCVLVMSAVLVPATTTISVEQGATVQVLSETYTAYVLDAYAVTDVERVLYNADQEPTDHVFVFTIPRDALISNFSLEVDGVTYYADVLGKEEAEERYQQAVDEGRNAGLVSALGDQRFSYKVSLQAFERMTATIRYEQVLLKENGWYTYHLPMVSRGGGYVVGDLEVDMTIDSPSPIDELETSGYEGSLTSSIPEATRGRVTMSAVDTVPGEDIEVRWRTAPTAPEGKMYFGEFEGMGYFVHVFDPDPAAFGEGRVAKDFVFVLDTSGSMRGTKFEQAQDALKHIYGSLSKEDRFSFVHFSGTSQKYSESLIRAKPDAVSDVKVHIQHLSASGSTNIHSGVVDALDIFKSAGDTVPVIVLLTDGNANTGLYHRSTFRDDVKERNTVDASIFSIALGNRADWAFVEALAMENDGRAIWVLENEDVVSRISDFVRSFSSPLLARLSFDYGPLVTDVHPSQVPAHYEGSEVLVTGRFPLGTDIVPMSMEAISSQGEVQERTGFPVDACPGGDYVPRFWAFQRIRELEDRTKYNGTDNETVDEIERLGIQFHFVTDHTSLFVDLPEDLVDRFYGEGEGQTYLDQRGGNLASYDASQGASGSNAYYSYPGPSDEGDAMAMTSPVPFMCMTASVIVLVAIAVALALLGWRSRKRGPSSPP